MSRIRRWLIGIALSLSALVTYCSWDSWEGVDVALPDGAGVLTFSRRHTHLFLAEYDYAVRLRLADGRDIESDITPNYGGRTVVLVQWQPAADGNGPFVMLEDDGRWTWANIGRGCLAVGGQWTDSTTVPQPFCDDADLPASHEWQYLGRIDDHPTEPGLRFVPGSEMPRDLRLTRQIVSESIAVPGTSWSFTIVKRPHPLDQRHEHWVQVTNPQGIQVRSWFADDLSGSYATTVSLYPAQEGAGPFLQFGQFERGLFESQTDCIVLDLRQARAFHLYGYHGVGPQFMISVENELQGRINVAWRGHEYQVRNDAGPIPPVLPVPEVLQREQPITLGTIPTWPDTKWLAAESTAP